MIRYLVYLILVHLGPRKFVGAYLSKDGEGAILQAEREYQAPETARWVALAEIPKSE